MRPMGTLAGGGAQRCGNRNRLVRFSVGLCAAALLVFSLLALTAACGKGQAPAASAAVSESREESSPRAAVRAEASGYLFTLAEKAAVGEFLKRNPSLRVATDADRSRQGGQSDARNLYGIYHPYFVRGDLNDDGILDFVLAFVRRDSGRGTPWFSVVVFTGRGGSGGGVGFSAGTFLERDISLSRGDLSIDRDAILITPDLADEAVRRYRWDPVRRSYIFVRDDPEDTETPVVSQT